MYTKKIFYTAVCAFSFVQADNSNFFYSQVPEVQCIDMQKFQTYSEANQSLLAQSADAKKMYNRAAQIGMSIAFVAMSQFKDVDFQNKQELLSALKKSSNLICDSLDRNSSVTKVTAVLARQIADCVYDFIDREFDFFAIMDPQQSMNPSTIMTILGRYFELDKDLMEKLFLLSKESQAFIVQKVKEHGVFTLDDQFECVEHAIKTIGLSELLQQESLQCVSELCKSFKALPDDVVAEFLSVIVDAATDKRAAMIVESMDTIITLRKEIAELHEQGLLYAEQLAEYEAAFNTLVAREIDRSRSFVDKRYKSFYKVFFTH